jgi:hypothetical protein
MESAMTEQADDNDVITMTKAEVLAAFTRWESECDSGSDIKNAIRGAKAAVDGDAGYRAARSSKLFLDYLAEVQS